MKSNRFRVYKHGIRIVGVGGGGGGGGRGGGGGGCPIL